MHDLYLRALASPMQEVATGYHSYTHTVRVSLRLNFDQYRLLLLLYTPPHPPPRHPSCGFHGGTPIHVAVETYCVCRRSRGSFDNKVRYVCTPLWNSHHQKAS